MKRLRRVLWDKAVAVGSILGVMELVRFGTTGVITGMQFAFDGAVLLLVTAGAVHLAARRPRRRRRLDVREEVIRWLDGE